ncbi:hypothetical protein [Gordonia sp. NB41Y]|uniref:hypothetical protein n=1 Tax=Gordonia sp. NB41Y TaxID=875808 RepID=UPI0002BF7806|nr:hypothetical protein [Gordonia sp. NB41Y]EMP13504.1 hypothetical protein ISGA_342 [Gordonia sp. NB41Y]WLP91448.1 hypothetical protein Q9K23_04060 [Gordonia sp. NB41Y]
MTVTIRQTGEPSRSKQAGPCWIRAFTDTDPVYATTAPKELTPAVGTTLIVEGKVILKRATRTSTDRRRWELTVTGRPEDTVAVSLGSPQSIDALLTGVSEVIA